MATDEQRSLGLGHELRSHLSLIKGYAQYVVRMLRRPDVSREDILTQAELLERHVADLETVAQGLEQDRATAHGPRPE